MKIEHTEVQIEMIKDLDALSVLGHSLCTVTFPHSCTVPNCPGDLNRLKLELWDEIVECLGECRQTLFDLGKLSWVRQGKPIGRRIDAALKSAKALK